MRAEGVFQIMRDIKRIVLHEAIIHISVWAMCQGYFWQCQLAVFNGLHIYNVMVLYFTASNGFPAVTGAIITVSS